MEIQVEHLARNLLSSIEPWKTAALKRKIEIYTSGVLPHAQEVLPALYHRLANPRLLSMRTPHIFQMPQRCDFDWQPLRRELTKSLSTGIFLNMELHAPESRSSSGQLKLRPLYFCSAIGSEYIAKILSRTSSWYSSFSNELIPRLGVRDISSGDIEVSDIAYSWDSDVEIEEGEASGSATRNKHLQSRR